MTYESVRGMRDILPEEVPYWTLLEESVREIARRFNYREIRPPLVEHTELFSRGIGETTDVVNKEMYTFPDKKGRSLTLRPEATASVVRAYIEHGMYTNKPFQKLFYVGPMFRYDKPQKGRSRQFHQYGVEALGSLDPSLDAEVIDLAWTLMEKLEVSGLSLRLNSIGCAADRARYREVLREYFADRIGAMCEDCKRRHEENPLRILDCKVERCQRSIDDALELHARYLERVERLRDDRIEAWLLATPPEWTGEEEDLESQLAEATARRDEQRRLIGRLEALEDELWNEIAARLGLAAEVASSLRDRGRLQRLGGRDTRAGGPAAAGLASLLAACKATPEEAARIRDRLVGHDARLATALEAIRDDQCDAERRNCGPAPSWSRTWVRRADGWSLRRRERPRP